MKAMKFGILLIIIFFLTSALMLIPANITADEGSHTRQIQGRTVLSDGLPNKSSFTTVEVFDANGNGQDELYLGGGGRGSVKTAGIHAFEYDNEVGEWQKFGTGLPGKSSGKYYGALSFGDVNHDGNLDLIAPLHTQWYSGNKNGIEVYLGDGAGAFSLKHTISTGESLTEAEVADIDNDGDFDIAVSSNSAIRVWFGSGSDTNWIEKSPTKAGNEITGIATADLNNDGLLDLVGCPYSNSRAIRMYIQTSKRTWEEVKFKNVKNKAFGIKITDINSDGNSDIIYGTGNEGIRAWLGNGGGSIGGTDFQWEDGSMGLHDSGGYWSQLELQDLTGDGKPELIAANNGGDEVYLYLNDLPKGWAWIFTGDSGSDDPLLNEDTLFIGGEPYGANFGDWDGDGEWDLAACSWGKGVKAWLIEGEGSTTGAGSNNSVPITYPDGGRTPPKLIGFDEQLTSWTLVKIGFTVAAVIFFVLIFLIYRKKYRRMKR
ncbi:FG-GAP repeat domain-containing protein [[Eubacterium] cellulosolvens]